MKQHFVLWFSLGLISFALTSPSPRAADFDDAHRFIFYAVLEGCFEDGLSTEDASQILQRREKESYFHFIYACPICMPTIHALEIYRSRPSHFFGLKSGASTFGSGLTPDLKKQLHSDKPEDRLAAINELMQGWISKRMSLLKLSDAERTQLKAKLEEMRKKGMGSLKHLEASDSAAFRMSAFKNVRQCAVCNGACGLKLEPDAGR
jgi:hypothetical protein